MIRMHNIYPCDKGKLEKEAKTEKDKSRRPLLPKSAVCRLLAEMVKSYAGCARLD